MSLGHICKSKKNQGQGIISGLFTILMLWMSIYSYPSHGEERSENKWKDEEK
jgi:hypothetical protein